MNADRLKRKFTERFGDSTEAAHTFFAPGRINLIGEHLDYNGGYVLPCALTVGTHLVIKKREDKLLKIASENFDASLEISLEDFHDKVGNEWWNYPLGVIHEFRKLREIECGFEILFSGNLPVGVGLSSSASIEMVAAFAINHLLKRNLSLKDLALLSQKAENDFVGVQCGIMDQYAVAFGKKEHALFLNCANVEHEYVSARLPGFSFIISNTNKPRQLEFSAFNERYRECRLALKTMQRLLSVNEIAEATPEQFENIEHWFPDENTRKRARHLVFENERVKKVRAALLNKDANQLGLLMNDSHISLRDYFEVSCPELEAMVHAAQSVKDCLGSRISGGGFGGCIISLVRSEMTEKFCLAVEEKYRQSTGLQPEFYYVEIGDGVYSLR